MPKANPMQATRQMTQAEYLEILFIDCGFTREQRNAFISAEVGREIKALDEISWRETSTLINKLKATKIVKRELLKGQGRGQGKQTGDWGGWI